MRLGYGLGIATVGTRGGVSDTPDVGGWLLDGETDGLAFDFAAFRAHIKDTATPANAYHSIGQISSSGALIGPAAKITYSSPSAKMCRQADGLLKYGAHNLYLNSASPANQSITVVSGATYAITITGTVSITWSGAYVGATTAGTTTFTAASGTLTGGSTSGSGTVHVYKTPAVSTYVATAGAAVYQLPYTYDINGDCEGILVEGQSTNLFTYSEQLDNAAGGWAETNATVALNATAGPSGETTADKITATAGGACSIAKTFTGAAAPYTLSVFVKDSTAGHLLLTLHDGTTAHQQWFNLTTHAAGSAGTGSATARSPEQYANGFYRYAITATMAATTCTATVSVADADADTTPAAGASFFQTGAQLEALAFPTSYIPTVGATVTRALDALTLADTLFPLSDTEGTLYAHSITPYAHATLSKTIVGVDDGTNNERVYLGYNTASTSLSWGVYDGGVAQAFSTIAGSLAVGTEVKVAGAYKLNDMNFGYNGVAGTTDTSGTMPTMTTLRINNRGSGSATLDGIIKSVAYIPRRMSDAELEELTT